MWRQTQEVPTLGRDHATAWQRSGTGSVPPQRVRSILTVDDDPDQQTNRLPKC